MTNIALCNRALVLIGEAPLITSLEPPEGTPHALIAATLFDSALKWVNESRHWTFADKRVALAKIALSPTADPITDLFTTIPAHGLVDDNPVSLELVVQGGPAVPEPLEEDVVYYVIGATTTTFALSETVGGTTIDLTTAGSGQWRVNKESDRSGYALMYALPTDCLIERNIVPEGAPDDWPDGATGAAWGSSSPAPGSRLFFPPVPASYGRVQRIPYKRALNVANESVIYTDLEDAELFYSAYIDDVTQWPPMFQEAVVHQVAAGLISSIKRDPRAGLELRQIAQSIISEATRVDAQRVVSDQARGYVWDR